ncbi:porin family protein [Roseivirga sp. BDSF3-8]|uniref:porin family protein n=1 Tax=Roseivirga sp. BDSF3-8 TaxID=3241598 RepID=UPI0035327129
MKKISIFTLLICAIFTTTSFAQGPEIGIKGGLNYSTLTGDFDGLEGSIGWHAGLAFGLNFTDSYTLQPEILLSSQGVDFEDVDDSGLNLLYLNIPVLAKFRFAEIAYFEAGPYIGFLINEEYEINGEEVDIDDTFKSTDYGVIAGVGVDLIGGFGAGVRYQLGLNNIADDSDDVNNPFDDDGDPSNGVFQVYAAYYFGR